MQYIGLLNTAIRTCNQGDFIIVESVKRELFEVLSRSFVIELPTHAPIMRKGEFGIHPEGNSDYCALQRMDYAFLCGTNLLANNITNRWNQWNIQENDLAVLGDKVVAVGIGSSSSYESISRRAKNLYSSAFSKSYFHSVRDERTKFLLESCGLRALNTGCATMWMLTDEFCEKIPSEKSDVVVTTLTDYKQDPVHDAQLLELLLKMYKEVNFWIQGIDDLAYVTSLGFVDKVKLISPNLEAYNEFLKQTECDYIGTRLHAGIKAMQARKRSIIIGVDDRSFDISSTYGINCVPRDDIERIRDMTNSTFETHVGINEDAINEFRSQFGELGCE